MQLSRKYRYTSICFFIVFIVFAACLQAQQEAYDTLSTVTIAPDTSIEQTDDGAIEDPFRPATTHYFRVRELQSNGGGPDSIRLRQVPDSFVKTQLGDKDFWYANYIFKKKKEKESESDGDSFFVHPAFQAILWIVIIASFAAFLVVYLSNSNVSLFQRKNRRIDDGMETEIETDNIFEINYEKAIEKAVGNNNYRLAVRLMFLRLLKNLSDNRIIDYKTDRTNFDYLLQLSSTAYYADFFRLTRNYEYVWYGHFDIDADKFPFVRRDFENFEHKIGKS